MEAQLRRSANVLCTSACRTSLRSNGNLGYLIPRSGTRVLWTGEPYRFAVAHEERGKWETGGEIRVTHSDSRLSPKELRLLQSRLTIKKSGIFGGLYFLSRFGSQDGARKSFFNGKSSETVEQGCFLTLGWASGRVYFLMRRFLNGGSKLYTHTAV